MIQRILLATATTIWLSACGTEVKVGRNDTYTPGDDSLLGADPARPGETGGTGNATALTCLGAAPALDPDVKKICDETPADLKATFGKAFHALCEEKKFSGQWQAGCSWSGADSKEKYLRVLAKSDVKSADLEFSLWATFSVTVAGTPKNYAMGVIEGYADPKFTEKYVSVKNSKLSKVTVVKTGEEITYHVELATSAAVVSYDGNIRIHGYSNGWYGVFDQAVADKALIVTNHFMYLIKPKGTTGSYVVAFDEKVVNDGGNHPIAAQTAIGLDKERMDLAMENAKRREGVTP